MLTLVSNVNICQIFFNACKPHAVIFWKLRLLGSFEVKLPPPIPLTRFLNFNGSPAIWITVIYARKHRKNLTDLN